jgi:hypothetical protein
MKNIAGLELDDLKDTWKKLQSDELMHEEEDRGKIKEIIGRSRKVILTSLAREIIPTTIIYLSFFGVVILFPSSISSFHYKLTIIIGLFAIPVIYRLFRSASFLKQIDYGLNIRTNLMEFLVYYKNTILLYRWGGYITICTLIVVFFTDASFIHLQLWIQALTLAYLIIWLIALNPLIKHMYGKKIKLIESYMRDLDSNEL